MGDGWKGTILAGVVVGLALAQVGCGAILFPTNIDVEVQSNDDQALFSAPKRGIQARSGMTLNLDRHKDHAIVVTNRDGSEKKEARIESGLSPWRIAVSVVLNGGHGIFTLFISTAVGIAADLRAGAWWTLDPDPLVVDFTLGSPPVVASTQESPAVSGACPKCRAVVESGTKFCVSCGARVRQ